MPAITAATVNELRQRTGLGMMDCKKALEEAGGDLDLAIENLRKKGVKAGVAARTATEGRLHLALAADGKSGSVVEVLCNTDFTARSEPVTKLLDLAARAVLENENAQLAEIPEIKAILTQVAQQTGENVTLGRAKVLRNPEGRVGKFLYTVTNKIGVLVATSGNASDELINDLCLHITAFKPVSIGLKREDVPADLVAKEREIAVERAKATGKPQNIAEKIAEGQMNAFFKERILPEQDFINPEKFKGTVGDMLKKAGVTLNGYIRLEVGQD